MIRDLRLSDDLSTTAGRLAADIHETTGDVCELRGRATGELAERLATAAAALFDAQTLADELRDSARA